MSPKTFSAMLSNVLYEKRFGPYFVEPVIAGLDPYTSQPYVCNMDLVSTYCMPECGQKRFWPHLHKTASVLLIKC